MHYSCFETSQEFSRYITVWQLKNCLNEYFVFSDTNKNNTLIWLSQINGWSKP